MREEDSSLPCLVGRARPHQAVDITADNNIAAPSRGGAGALSAIDQPVHEPCNRGDRQQSQQDKDRVDDRGLQPDITVQAFGIRRPDGDGAFPEPVEVPQLQGHRAAGINGAACVLIKAGLGNAVLQHGIFFVFDKRAHILNPFAARKRPDEHRLFERALRCGRGCVGRFRFRFRFIGGFESQRADHVRVFGQIRPRYRRHKVVFARFQRNAGLKAFHTDGHRHAVDLFFQVVQHGQFRVKAVVLQLFSLRGIGRQLRIEHDRLVRRQGLRDNCFFIVEQLCLQVVVINDFDLDGVAGDAIRHQRPHAGDKVRTRDFQCREGIIVVAVGIPFPAARLDQPDVRGLALDHDVDLFHSKAGNVKGRLQAAFLRENRIDGKIDPGFYPVDQFIEILEYIVQVLRLTDLDAFSVCLFRDPLKLRDVRASFRIQADAVDRDIVLFQPLDGDIFQTV